MDIAKTSKVIFICLFLVLVGYNVNLFYNQYTVYRDYSLVRESVFSFESRNYCTILEKQKYLDVFGNIMFRILLLLYIKEIWPVLFNKDSRKKLKIRNTKLKQLRSKSTKSLKEQKEFLNMRYPTKPPFVWSWKNVGLVFLAIFKFMLTMILLTIFLNKINLFYPLWTVIMTAVVLPYIINLVLKKYNYEQDYILGEMLK